MLVVLGFGFFVCVEEDLGGRGYRICVADSEACQVMVLGFGVCVCAGEDLGGKSYHISAYTLKRACSWLWGLGFCLFVFLRIWVGEASVF